MECPIWAHWANLTETQQTLNNHKNKLTEYNKHILRKINQQNLIRKATIIYLTALKDVCSTSDPIVLYN